MEHPSNEEPQQTILDGLREFSSLTSLMVSEYERFNAFVADGGAISDFVPVDGAEGIWEQIISIFLACNGYFDNVLFQQGLPTSGIVDMSSLMHSMSMTETFDDGSVIETE